MPGEPYTWEEREPAEALYCVDGLTYEQVAARTEIPISTLKRWGSEHGWMDKRREIAQARASIRENTIRLRARLIANCLDTLNPMDAFAVGKLEDLALKAEAVAADRSAPGQSGASLRRIESDADAVAALEEAVSLRLAEMCGRPDQVSLRSVKEVSEAMSFIRGLRQAAGQTDSAGPKALTPETAEAIRASLLGGGA